MRSVARRHPGLPRRDRLHMTPDPRPNSGPPPLRWTNVALDTFWGEHPDWVQALPGDGPHYAVPGAALDGPALEGIFGAQLVIERDFTRLCDEHGIIGVWRRRTIACHLLTRPPLQLDPTLLARLNWDARQVAMIRDADARTDSAHARLQGVVGWLLTEPTFLAEVVQLRAGYDALPVAERPSFPLGRVTILESPSGQVLHAGTAAFAGGVRQFLDRWGLTRLITWELPDPQGPLLPNFLPEGPARPAHGVHVFLPLHYPLQGDDDLLGRVREFQRQQALELGLPSAFAGVAHHAQYAQMFRLMHLDRAVRGRFGGRPPRGIVSALEAAASHLGIGAESVRRLWKWIRICHRGGRQTIRRLRD